MTRIQITLVLASLLFAKVSLCQVTISGTVKNNSSNESLPEASIYMPDIQKGATTNMSGKYQLKNIKPGTYLFEITYVDYKSIIKKITISKDTIINFNLLEAHKELTEVVITGVGRATELRNSPIIIKAESIAAMNQNGSTNLIDGLKSIPGINQVTTGPSISKPIIRGMGYNRIITLVDGIRQEGQQWGDEHGIEVDQYSIDRVEIVKGPGSLMYGSDGIAGVLNFISPKAPPIGQIKTTITSNYQTNNNLIGTSLFNIGNKNDIQWAGRFSNKIAGNYSNKYDGKVYNSGFKETDGSLMLGVNKKWGHSYITASSYNSTLNLVEGDRDSTGNFVYTNANGQETEVTSDDLKGYKIGFPHQKIQHVRISSNNYFLLKTGTLNADFGFQNNKRKEFSDPTHPNDMALYFDLNTFNYNVYYNLEDRKGWETSFGFGGMQQTNTNKGLEVLIPEYSLFDIGAFALTSKTFNKITFSTGLRFDNRNINSKSFTEEGATAPKFLAFTKNYNGISGSVGLSYKISKNSTLKTNFSRGFRAPNIAELASNGKHEGTFKYEIGDPNLKSEISHQLDIAYFLNSDHISLEITPFVNFISNYIYSKKLIDPAGNPVYIDPADPVPAFKFTQGSAKLLGGEVYLDIHPHPLDWLCLTQSFSYVQATQKNQTDSTKYLPYIPGPKYTAEIKANFKIVNDVISGAYIKFNMDHFFAQNNIFSAYNTETPTPSYTLLSAGIGGNIKMYHRKDFLCLFISLENIGDVAYQNHLSRLKYAPENVVTGRTGVYNMGRNLSIKAIFNI